MPDNLVAAPGESSPGRCLNTTPVRARLITRASVAGSWGPGLRSGARGSGDGKRL